MDYDVRTDEELLARLKEDDADAFAAMYRRYHDILYLYALRLIEDESHAGDIVQDIFLSIWEKRRDVRAGTLLKPYLLQAARYRFLNIIKHLKIRQKAVDHFQRYLDAGDYQVDNHIEEKELVEKLQRIVEGLPGKMAAVFRMRQDNLPDEEIAARLGISEKTVKNLMSQSLRSLQKLLSCLFFFL